MPLIRWTHPKDVARHGDAPFHVLDWQARQLLADRRAESVDEAALSELTKPELAGVAEQVGADVRKRDSKGHFVKAIAEADEP